jgi:Spy/CpxP family protein refolding chaperone
MKKFTTQSLLIAGSVALMATAAYAGPWGGPSMGCDPSDRGMERITEQLNLTETQQEQIRSIRDEQRQQREAQRAAVRERIDAVLTPEQLALRDQQMEQRQTRKLDRMAERLDLTAEQQDAVAALMQEKRADPTMGRDQMRERMQTILSEDQLAELDDMRSRHGGGRPGPGGWFN